MATNAPWVGVLTQMGLTVIDIVQPDSTPGNLADIPERVRNTIGDRVAEDTARDDGTRSEWLQAAEASLRMAKMVADRKDFPWEDCSNIVYPLVAEAALGFQARAYPAIVDGDKVVKGKVIGPDPEGKKRARAKRIGEHMSWQTLVEMREWEDQTDRLLLVLPIVGDAHRRVWWDSVLQRNCSEYISSNDVIVNNSYPDLSRAPRISRRFGVSPRDVFTHRKSGYWYDVEVTRDDTDDEDADLIFIEQHRYLDLDGDGYPEPYICVIHEQSRRLMRLAPNWNADKIQTRDTPDGLRVIKIEAEEYYVHYVMMPDPEGGYYGLGLGWLLSGINDAASTAINQMFDAGTRQNAGGGFIGVGAAIESGRIEYAPGEWVKVKVPGSALRENMVPFDHSGPSTVLFQLVGFLTDGGRRLAGIHDVLTGEAGRGNTPVGTILAQIEQGLKVFTATYKRIHRAFADEFRLLARLNKLYLQPEAYYAVGDQQQHLPREDYDDADVDVVPVSDPTVVTEMQRIGKSQFLLSMKDDPFMNPLKIRARILEGAGVDSPEDLLDPDSVKQAKETQQKQMEIQSKLALAEEERKTEELRLERTKVEAAAKRDETAAVLNVAKAEAEAAGIQIETYKAMVDKVTADAKAIAASADAMMRNMEEQDEEIEREEE